MIRLLVLCEYFPPENKIGAVRPAKIAKYLGLEEDIAVHVVCAQPQGMVCCAQEQMFDGVTVRRVNRSKLAGLLRKKRKGTAQPSGEGTRPAQVKSLKRRLITYVLRVRDLVDREVLYIRTKHALRGQYCDVLLSTFNTDLGHRAALWYKKRHPQTKWIADFRDPTWSEIMPPKQKLKMIELARKTAQCCNVITAVTRGILDVHEKEFRDTPCYVIPNGYDLSDREKESPLQDGIFRLVYTGELYDGKRDLTPVFRALVQAAEKGTMDLSRVEVVYAGQSGAVFAGQAARYPEIPVNNQGFVSREDALKLQDQAQMLLLSSWCSSEDKHTLTGKFFEYLSADKPIVCTISGNGSQSALSEAIRAHGLGVCYEQANENDDFSELCAYLEKQYACFVQENKTDFQPDREYIQQFSYEKLAKRFCELIKE